MSSEPLDSENELIMLLRAIAARDEAARGKAFSRILLVMILFSMAYVMAQPVAVDFEFSTGEQVMINGAQYPPVEASLKVTAPYYVWCAQGVAAWKVR